MWLPIPGPRGNIYAKIEVGYQKNPALRMLRDWSDEWKNARLALELRAEELFQGETLRLVIRATVMLDTTPMHAAAHDTAGTPQSEAAMPLQEVRAAALEQLETRWRRHCDGALVDLKVVEPSKGTAVQQQQQALTQAPQQPRATLFHQESRLVLLPLTPEDATAASASAATLRVTMSLRCECTLRVRAEFWQRPLVLIARVTPNATREEGGGGFAVSSSTPLSSQTQLLGADFLNNQVFRLLREQTAEPPNLTRRVEHKLRVVKPLVLKMETKFLRDQRVAVLARATNTHDTLGVRVLDLQLHVNQFAGGSLANPAKLGAPKGADYRVAKTTDDPFPVELEPLEQFNFVFVLEPIGGPGGGSAVPATATADALSPHSHQSLLTLSWEALPPTPGDGTAAAVSLLQPITEHHTILWSPHAHSHHASTKHTSPSAELLEFVPKPPPLIAQGDFKIVRRGVDRACPLSVYLAPLDSTHLHRVGVVETLCVVVANRSPDKTDFDLSLVVPPAGSAHRSWLAFEASHHLGRLRPGTIVRKSLRLVFLRGGRVDLNALLLFDHVSRTWFLPPPASTSTAWDVVVHA